MNTSHRHRLGQHFLTNPRIADKIVSLAGVTDKDTVLEIGPGKGILTDALLKTGCHVIAVEKDHSLAEALKEKYVADERIEIYLADFLKFDLELVAVGRGEQVFRERDPASGSKCLRSDRTRPNVQQRATKIKVVANLPYSIATEIIFKLIDHRHLFSTLHLMVQKEVADRLVSRPGGKAYGILSILTQLYSKSRIVMKLPPGAFHPPPKVDSAVVAMSLSDKPRVDVKDVGMFKKMVKQAFSTRRKMLKNALQIKDDPKWHEICSDIGMDPKVRAEELNLEQFSKLASSFLDRL